MTGPVAWVGVPPQDGTVTPPPASGALVHPGHPNLSSAVWLDKSTRVKWARSMGDWLDGNGVVNGPAPTKTATGASVTIDVSDLPSDLILQGGRASAISLDGVDITAQCFYTDPGSAYSLALPNGTSGPPDYVARPIIVPRNSGSSLHITAYSGTPTWRVDAASLPEAVDLPYTGSYRAPDIFLIDCTSDSAILTTVASTTYASPLCLGVWEYGTDSFGINYVRWSVRLSDFHPRLTNVIIPLANLTEVYVQWWEWIEDDVWPSMAEIGIKQSGPGRSNPEAAHAIGEHSGGSSSGSYPWPKNARNSPIIGQDYYLRDVLTGGNNPRGNYAFCLKLPGRWYVNEIRVKMNTAGNTDGVLQMWCNGHLICDEVHQWVTDVATNGKWTNYQFQLYHGGTGAWLGPAHYRQARVSASSQYIGVDPILTGGVRSTSVSSRLRFRVANSFTHVAGGGGGSFPAWRSAMPNKDTWYTIANTASMNNTSGDNRVVNTWNGFGAGPHTWYAFLNGGHGCMENKFQKIDFSADAPAWVLLNAGTTNDSAHWPAQDSKLAYYTDGLPASRHTDYGTKFIAQRNRVMTFPGGYALGGDPPAQVLHVDGANPDTGAYDAAGTWADPPSAFLSGIASASAVVTCAQNPSNGDVYVSGYGHFARWNQAANTWSIITPGTVPSWWASIYCNWEFKASLIDVTGGRNRWVSWNGAFVQCMDLTTYDVTANAVGGDWGSTSTTTLTVASSGSQDVTLATSTNLSNFAVGSRVACYRTDDHRYFFSGTVTAYNPPVLTIQASYAQNPGGSYSTWIVTPLSNNYAALVHDLDNDRYLAGKDNSLYALDPVTWAVTRIGAITPSYTGSGIDPGGYGGAIRLAYFQELGGVAYLPSFTSNILFMPTRTTP